MPTDIGEMQVGLSLDESSFTQSMNSLERSMDELGGKFDGINADTKRAEMSIGGLGKQFALLGLAGVTGLTAIAKNTPAVTGSMASIGISVMRIKNQIGEEMAPAFDKAAEGFENFANEVETKGTLVATLDAISKATDKLIIDPITERVEKKATSIQELAGDPMSFFSLEKFGTIGSIIQMIRNRNKKEDEEYISMNSPDTIIT